MPMCNVHFHHVKLLTPSSTHLQYVKHSYAINKMAEKQQIPMMCRGTSYWFRLLQIRFSNCELTKYDFTLLTLLQSVNISRSERFEIPPSNANSIPEKQGICNEKIMNKTMCNGIVRGQIRRLASFGKILPCPGTLLAVVALINDKTGTHSKNLAHVCVGGCISIYSSKVAVPPKNLLFFKYWFLCSAVISINFVAYFFALGHLPVSCWLVCYASISMHFSFCLIIGSSGETMVWTFIKCVKKTA